MKTKRIEVLNNSSQSKTLIAAFSGSKASKVGVLYQTLIGEHSPQNYQLSELEAYKIIRNIEIVVIEILKANLDAVLLVSAK